MKSTKNIVDRYVFPKKLCTKVSKTKSNYRKYIESKLRQQLNLSKNSKHFSFEQQQTKNDLEYLQKHTKEAFRTFDIPGWKDNFYTNLLDYSSNNYLFTGFQNKLKFHSLTQDDLEKKNYIILKGSDLTSIKNSPMDTNKISLGFFKDSFKVIDLQKNKTIFEDKSHLGRISVIQWKQNVIISGCKDQRMRFFDIRKNKMIKMNTQLNNSHSQEVCGIKKYGNFIASGGNDNKVFIYDIRKQRIYDSYSHNAAVKAITWKNQKMLITGGGTADKKIKLWSSQKGVYSQIQTGSQVCSISWSQSTSQIISCQGFSLNQIIIWSQKGQRQYTFHGHSSRVLYSIMSPSGEYLATGAGDKTLKVWKLFKGKQYTQLQNMMSVR